MKRLFVSTLLASLTLGSLPPLLAATPDNPGFVDFGNLTASSEGEFVQINVNRGLIQLASACASSLEPEVTDMLDNLEHVRVNVVGLGDDNREATAERSDAVRADLMAHNWEEVVNVQEGGGDTVHVYLKHEGGEAIQGIVVLILSGEEEAVFINIVGNIKPSQIAAIGQRFEIAPLQALARR